jgi:ribonuclease Z
MTIVDEYVFPPDVTEDYKNVPRTDKKSPAKEILSGKWKGYTPPAMPGKK